MTVGSIKPFALIVIYLSNCWALLSFFLAYARSKFVKWALVNDGSHKFDISSGEPILWSRFHLLGVSQLLAINFAECKLLRLRYILSRNSKAPRVIPCNLLRCALAYDDDEVLPPVSPTILRRFCMYWYLHLFVHTFKDAREPLKWIPANLGAIIAMWSHHYWSAFTILITGGTPASLKISMTMCALSIWLVTRFPRIYVTLKRCILLVNYPHGAN
jgi:hypothetical protein